VHILNYNLLGLYYCILKLPEDGTHGAETCRSLMVVMKCILLSAFVG